MNILHIYVRCHFVIIKMISFLLSVGEWSCCCRVQSEYTDVPAVKEICVALWWITGLWTGKRCSFLRGCEEHTHKSIHICNTPIFRMFLNANSRVIIITQTAQLIPFESTATTRPIILFLSFLDKLKTFGLEIRWCAWCNRSISWYLQFTTVNICCLQFRKFFKYYDCHLLDWLFKR